MTRIGQEKDIRYLPGLFALFNRRTGDKTLDTMVEHSLRDFLAAFEKETVEKLSKGTADERKLCLQVAGNNRFTTAAPFLVEMTGTETDDGILTAVFLAMAEINDPLFGEIFRKNATHPDRVISGICNRMVQANS